MRYVKQFGLQRSGTNAVKALLELNFKDVHVLSNFLGDKHAEGSWSTMRDNLSNQMPGDFELNAEDFGVIHDLVVAKKLPLVFNIKAPASWVNSYYNYQKKKVLFKNPSAEFLFDISFARRVLDKYESVVGSWLELMDDSECFFVFVHEEVVAGVDSDKLDNISHVLGGEVSELFPVGRLSGYAKRGVDSQHGKDLINEKMRFDRDYHLEGGWEGDVPNEVMSFLLERQCLIFDNFKSLKPLLAGRF